MTRGGDEKLQAASRSLTVCSDYDPAFDTDTTEVGSKALWTLLGSITLGGFNFLLQAIPFFQDNFDAKHWDDIFIMVYMGSTVCGNALLVAVAMPFNLGYFMGLLGLTASFIIIPGLALLYASWKEVAEMAFLHGCLFPAALLSVAVFGLHSAVFSSVVVGLAGSLNPQYVGAIMAGQGYIGIVSFVMNLGLVKMTIPENRIVLICFAFCTLLNVSGIYVRRFLSSAGRSSRAGSRLSDTSTHDAMQIPELLTRASPQLLNVFLNMCFTFIVFPGVTLKMKTEPVYVIGTFQVFDVVARLVPLLPEKIGISPASLKFLILSRVMFIAIFITFSMSTENPVFGSYQSALECTILSIFALTNGWGISLSMIYGPQQVVGEEKRVGMIMMFGLTSGIFTGSVVALVMNHFR